MTKKFEVGKTYQIDLEKTAAVVEENSAVVIGSIDEELDGSQEDDEESTLDTAAITFDVSVMEEFIPLSHGMTICMATWL